MTQPGYQRWAEGVLDQLLAGYGDWKAGAALQTTAPSPSPVAPTTP